jgi:hypothetical protein
MKNPYFSLEGLYFQTAGDSNELFINVQKAMDVLRHYALYGGQWDEAMTALAFLEEVRPELQTMCDEMRVTFLIDDNDHGNPKIRLARKAYNRMVDRLNGGAI